jgi:hypothetical protein
MALVAVFAVSCKRTPASQTQTAAEPVLNSVVLARKNSAYSDPDNILCLKLTNKICETVVVTLNFTNNSNLSIYSVKINTIEYRKADFKSGATPQKVQIEITPLFNTPGDYTIDVEEIYYSNGTNIKAVSNFTPVSQPVRVDPVFRMTLDMSASLLGSDAATEIYNDVSFMAYLDQLHDAGEMNASDIAPSGYGFAGWYTSPSPDIDKDKAYDTDDVYEFYKDMTFYAVYLPIYTYTLSSGNSAVITGLTKFGKSQTLLRLPETIDSYTVREIGSGAFSSSTSITNVYCNDSLIKIGPKAFKDCTALRAISFNDKLTEIAAQAFSSCTKLSNMTLFPDSLKTLGSKAFEYCGWDTTAAITIHAKTLFIPETLESIGSYCFQYSKFINIYFLNRESENIVDVSYGEGMFYSSTTIETVQTAAALGPSGVLLKTISGTVKGAPIIPEKSFEYCTALKTVNLAEGLQKVENEAFMCISGTMTGFTKLTLPDSLESIGKYAFGNVPLASLNFASEEGSLLQSIGDYAFQGSKLSGSVTLKTPELVNYGASPFYNSLGITAIFLNTHYVPYFKTANENTVQTLNNRIKYFVPETLLSSYKKEWKVVFTIGGYITNTVELNIYAQENITDDKKIAYDIRTINGIQSAVITNFFETAGTTVTVPDVIAKNSVVYDVREIGPYVASDSVTRVDFVKPENIVRIDDYAFYYSTRLRAFCADAGSNVSRFEKFTSLETIGKEAFVGTAIDNFKAPNNLITIDEYAFAHTTSLSRVFITGDFSNVSVYVGAFQYSGVDTVVLGSRVTAIHQLAFADCENLVYFVMEHTEQPATGNNVLFGILGNNPPASCTMYLTPTFYQYLVSNNTSFYKDYKKVKGGWDYEKNTVFTL